MSDRPFERAVLEWLEDGSDRTPRPAIDAVLLAVKTTPQERGPRISRRFTTMPRLVQVAAATALIAVVGFGAAQILGNRPGVGGPPTPSPSASITPSAAPSALAPTTFDTATIPGEFPLAFQVTVPAGWRIDHGNPKLALSLINTGNPPKPDSEWWGPEIWLVDGALVHDPADVVSDAPASADKARFVPWPSDYIAYLTALPGVTVVAGPRPITIGGVAGSEVIIDTPAMHPTTWLAGDFTWMGGGATGVDGPARRHVITLTVGTAHLVLGFADSAAAFEARDATVQSIFQTIAFAR